MSILIATKDRRGRNPMKIFARLGGIAVALGLAAGAASAAGSDALVSAEWLEQNLDNPDVRVFEVSVDTGVYERGHIPGAHHLNWHTDLVDTVKRDIVSREDFQETLRAAGVTPETTIV